MRTFLVLFPLAALVIFQPELRRILAEFGNQPLFNTARQERENVEILVRAMERLSKMRIGALVAVEQGIQLREAVESGVPLDCEATPEMLETIFFPNNAIHDGGVLIKGDRISYAACIFPLTQRRDLDKSIGTRHRAAVGLTEETDALVIIVSEETGSVSCAYKGELDRGVTLNELRSFLSSILVKRDQPRNMSEWIRFQRRRIRMALRPSRRSPRVKRESAASGGSAAAVEKPVSKSVKRKGEESVGLS